jgi:hypothetical protein
LNSVVGFRDYWREVPCLRERRGCPRLVDENLV